jgi:hypothetical protein
VQERVVYNTVQRQSMLIEELGGKQRQGRLAFIHCRERAEQARSGASAWMDDGSYSQRRLAGLVGDWRQRSSSGGFNQQQQAEQCAVRLGWKTEPEDLGRDAGAASRGWSLAHTSPLWCSGKNAPWARRGCRGVIAGPAEEGNGRLYALHGYLTCYRRRAGACLASGGPHKIKRRSGVRGRLDERVWVCAAECAQTLLQ